MKYKGKADYKYGATRANISFRRGIKWCKQDNYRENGGFARVFTIEELYKTIKNINLISFNPSDTIILYDKRLSEKKEENRHGASCDRLRRIGI